MNIKKEIEFYFIWKSLNYRFFVSWNFLKNLIFILLFYFCNGFKMIDYYLLNDSNEKCFL